MRISVIIAAATLLAANPGIAQSGDRTTQAPVVRGAELKASTGPAENFTGRVTVRPVVSPEAPGRASLGLVTFSPGARSNWHTHPAGQSLYVTDGCGWTQIDGSPVRRICAGDAAYVSAGVRHWHGATATTAMTHLAVSETIDGENVSWAEPVTAAQYKGPVR